MSIRSTSSAVRNPSSSPALVSASEESVGCSGFTSPWQARWTARQRFRVRDRLPEPRLGRLRPEEDHVPHRLRLVRRGRQPHEPRPAPVDRHRPVVRRESVVGVPERQHPLPASRSSSFSSTCVVPDGVTATARSGTSAPHGT